MASRQSSLAANAHNARLVQTCRTFATVVGGATAGILGLRGVYGGLFYVALMAADVGVGGGRRRVRRRAPTGTAPRRRWALAHFLNAPCCSPTCFFGRSSSAWRTSIEVRGGAMPLGNGGERGGRTSTLEADGRRAGCLQDRSDGRVHRRRVGWCAFRVARLGGEGQVRLSPAPDPPLLLPGLAPSRR
eukprot:TRINITY_DN1452_c0_g2_i1.p1 TRINITY_DN1452_c0_g2~~TRINITY_DN1452_c0_g2_i1.p1  ORF type:complete len:216 (-),score=1.10 TRINITY_DN1452_c0_g2_i1:109-672(-)